MKAKTSRTEIKIETHQIKVIRFMNKGSSGFCVKCGKQVTVLAVENVVEATDTALPDLIRLAKTEGLHVLDPSDSSQLICGNSLGGGET